MPRPECQSCLHNTAGPPYHPILALLRSGSRPLDYPGLTPPPGPAPSCRDLRTGPAPSSHQGPATDKKCSPGGGAERPSSVGTSGESHGFSLGRKPRSDHMLVLSLARPLTFP